VFDMVGNMREWVADWVRGARGCTDWTSQTGIPGGDSSCFGGASDPIDFPRSSIPGALARGGFWGDGTEAGVFAVADANPAFSGGGDGFRCAR
jgi:formylglycine-generating enzyme required for sulfatase activity